MTFRLEGRSLGCERDDRWLFANLDLSVEPGEMLRVEGPNGSGKTTLLKILSGQLAEHDGELLWNGLPMRRNRTAFLANLLYLGHAPGVKSALSPLENLAWYQALNGERGSEADRMAALDEIGLCGFEDVPVAQLSAGQQRRAALARMLLSPRPLWVLDEPFTAIDRQGVAALEARLQAHVARGGSVILTTHHELAPMAALRRVSLGVS
ncbi:cytochrome c biogenesis heme-transporting ATPase CcmA [Halomonas sp. McH1-25]|uniref:cytochrome c biogenesis heme-transporting ATPase CcmA n=1 Tax=unclassified Halomonas TaxID=2609666 RepID=UPI001EF5CF08|nr:cytochrome c biogenesis heme-transporting ATPase CcmA [Halomonas sp. McH1-25]MCP1344490.1 cytochrome c biogenesis heme-transporting ATPase CcmA [Halomonas sp. FL8]MCP1362960.1 cytochrome c biogenesis heme-transporting ATPase CcmA [Halomonas sp. BBD45]MCP1364739.1 cytochrome c biogenesis heme-transporting ATPase CcmA [Halomonas sp. BBD48]